MTVEAFYKSLFHNDSDAMLVLDGVQIVECNREAEILFGCARSDILFRSPWEVAPGTPFGECLIEVGWQALVERASQGERGRFEIQHRLDAERSAYYEVSLNPVTTALGNRTLLVVRDIDAQKATEVELKGQLRFQTTLAKVSERFMSLDRNQLEDHVNWALAYVGERYGVERISVLSFDSRESRVQRVYTWPQNDDTATPIYVTALSAPWIFSSISEGRAFHFSSLAEVPAHASADRRFLQDLGIRAGCVVPVIKGDNIAASVAFLMLSQARQWPDKERQELAIFVRVVATAWHNVQSQKKLEERDKDLLRSQRVAHLGSFSETAKPGQSLMDGFGILEQSPEARAIFQFEPGTETVERAMERIHPDDRARVLREAEAAFDKKSKEPMEFRLVLPDGRRIYVEQRAEAERDEQGRIRRWFGTVQDVTDRVEARVKLEDALAEIASLRDQLQDENQYLKSEVRIAHSANIVGSNARFNSALVAGRKVAPTDVTVLVLGETGTGKELIAREIHAHSMRSDAVMVSVNCAALSTDLIESELFGHEAGAFTGAVNLRRGRFELADKGTLFLDEIGDLSQEVQAKILRALQTGEFERLGGTTTIKVDVRLIAATNRDLRSMVLNGDFRADLYYRINSFPIAIPALRDRSDDIPMLARHFVDKYGAGLGKRVSTISGAMISHMQQKRWPGNVRELENYIQRALIAADGPVLDYHEEEEARGEHDMVRGAESWPSSELDSVQQQHILQILNRCDWVIGGEQGAAQVLGMPASTLRSRMKRLGIERPY